MTFDPCDGVLSMFRLLLCGLSLCVLLYGVLVHPRVPWQQPHVILFTVIADRSAIAHWFLEGSKLNKKCLIWLFHFRVYINHDGNHLQWKIQSCKSLTARGIQSEACKHTLGSTQLHVHQSFRNSHTEHSHIVHDSYLYSPTKEILIFKIQIQSSVCMQI